MSAPVGSEAGVLAWVRRNLFRTWFDGLLTLVFALGVGMAATKLFVWALVTAAVRPDPEACRVASGACWSVVVDMWPVFLVGLYPGDERWRLVVGIVVLAVAVLLALPPPMRRLWVQVALWVIATVTFMLLVRGGVFGLPVIDSKRWGGLLLTVILAVSSQSIAFPFGVLLALGRVSPHSTVVQTACAVYIEIVRSVPLVMILLMVTLILPVFLPPSVPLNTVFTAAVGITMFSAASIAEVVRGGLAGLSATQAEAATALGLGYWQTMRLVVLPQALRRVQPALVGTFINFVKGSTLVVAIGLYDLLGGAILASTNPQWVGQTVEPLLFVAFVFWAICFSLSRYSRRIERRFETRYNNPDAATAPALAETQ